MMKITLGMTGCYVVVVGPQHLGSANGLEDLPTLCNPWFTLFCEMAGDAAIRPSYGSGQSSVGVHVDLEHLAEVSAGSTLQIEATVKEVSGRRVHMEIRGRDAGHPFVRGTHDRVIIDVERFLARFAAAR